MCSCYSATSESAESPYNRVARVTRVLHTSCLCHQKSYRNVAWRVACHATMPGRPKRGSRWWAPPGCPAWMTKSEVDVLWKPEDDLEGEFDRAVVEQGESATARRKLMNYFIFNSTEIADWQEETDRASWYLRTTGSLTLLLLRSKVETYKSATYEERGSEDWMDRLFAASWPSAVAPQAAQSGSEADDHLSGIDDDSPSVANGDDSSVQMETNAVAPQAAQSGSEADDNLSGIDDDSPSVANGDDSLVQMETNAVAPQAAQSQAKQITTSQAMMTTTTKWTKRWVLQSTSRGPTYFPSRKVVPQLAHRLLRGAPLLTPRLIPPRLSPRMVKRLP